MKLRSTLLRWYDRGHRELPWRATRDPYRVWVSEIMLQQTRVETVLPYYARFLARFPDVRALAAAPLDDVLAQWSGLGYYRRARFLHAAAATLVREHEGHFPRELDAARSLPGIGRSTAGAIVSIAYGAREPVLDGNVKRVLSRLLALRGDPDDRTNESKLWQLARELVDCNRAGDVNQATMELGATVCLPFAAARCDVCPWRASCVAFERGVVAKLPRKAKSAALVARTWAVAIARRDERRLVHRRDTSGLLDGMFEFPSLELALHDATDARRTRAALAEFLRRRFGATFDVGRELLRHRHAISNRSVTQRAFEVVARGRTNGRASWRSDDEIGALALTTATRRMLAQLSPRDGALRSPRAATTKAAAAASASPSRASSRAPQSSR